VRRGDGQLSVRRLCSSRAAELLKSHFRKDLLEFSL
jgi:hypothetical protein